MRILIAIGMSFLLLAEQGRGCGVCNRLLGDSLSLPHPKAIEIAVATRAALDKGILREEAPEPPWLRGPGIGWDHRRKLSGAYLIKTWTEKADAPRAPPRQAPFCLHFVLIDTSETCAVHFRADAMLFEAKKCTRGDAVLATTCAALQAILTGEMPLPDAIEKGLVVIEGRRDLAGVLCP
jgi:hypothetical protein